MRFWINRFWIFFWKIRKIEISYQCLIHPDVELIIGFLQKRGIIILSKYCQLSKGVVIRAYGGKVELKENVFVGENVIIYGHGNVEIGANSLIAMHTCILSSNHTIPSRNEKIRDKPDILLPTKIGCDVWLGAGVIVLGGVIIGDGCVVGAGAVVTKDLPSYSIAVGNPAKVIRSRD